MGRDTSTKPGCSHLDLGTSRAAKSPKIWEKHGKIWEKSQFWRAVVGAELWEFPRDFSREFPVGKEPFPPSGDAEEGAEFPKKFPKIPNFPFSICPSSKQDPENWWKIWKIPLEFCVGVGVWNSELDPSSGGGLFPLPEFPKFPKFRLEIPVSNVQSFLPLYIKLFNSFFWQLFLLFFRGLELGRRSWNSLEFSLKKLGKSRVFSKLTLGVGGIGIFLWKNHGILGRNEQEIHKNRNHLGNWRVFPRVFHGIAGIFPKKSDPCCR